MVNVLDSRSSDPGSSAGQGHCVVFLGKINSHSASPHPGTCINGYGDKMLGGNLQWTSIPSRGVAILLVDFMLQKPG